MHGEGEEDPRAEMHRGGADPPWGRCAEMRRGGADPRGRCTEMLVLEAALVEEAVVGEDRDITSESSRWNLMAVTHKKWRLGHDFGIVRGVRWNVLQHHDFSFFCDFFFSRESAQLVRPHVPVSRTNEISCANYMATCMHG
jgi:hypothetical protein